MLSSRELLENYADDDCEAQEWTQFCASEAPSSAGDSTSGVRVRFAGCYMLSSMKRPRTYVGFTVNPSRRIKQHNGEILNGGAVRTSRNRPWRMVAIVHGFVTTTQALQFEWAWQNPAKTKSIRLHAVACEAQPLNPKRPRFPSPAQQVATLSTLLTVPPWSRCPLTITVCIPKEEWSTIVRKTTLPSWVRVNFRALTSLGSLDDYDYGSRELMPDQSLTGTCSLCSESTDASRRGTLCAQCGSAFHVHCLAAEGMHERDSNLPAPVLHPTQVQCPSCRCTIPWSEVVRFAHVVRRCLLEVPPAVTDTS